MAHKQSQANCLLHVICRDAGLGYSIPHALLTASHLIQGQINLTDAMLDRMDVVHDVAI